MWSSTQPGAPFLSPLVASRPPFPTWAASRALRPARRPAGKVSKRPLACRRLLSPGKLARRVELTIDAGFAGKCAAPRLQAAPLLPPPASRNSRHPVPASMPPKPAASQQRAALHAARFNQRGFDLAAKGVPVCILPCLLPAACMVLRATSHAGLLAQNVRREAASIAAAGSAPPLCLALAGDVLGLRQWLHSGGEPNCQGRLGGSLLHHAARHGKLACMEVSPAWACKPASLTPCLPAGLPACSRARLQRVPSSCPAHTQGAYRPAPMPSASLPECSCPAAAPAFLQVLLDAGAELEGDSAQGTPLHVALWEYQLAATFLLVQRQAVRARACKGGQSPAGALHARWQLHSSCSGADQLRMKHLSVCPQPPAFGPCPPCCAPFCAPAAGQTAWQDTAGRRQLSWRWSSVLATLTTQVPRSLVKLCSLLVLRQPPMERRARGVASIRCISSSTAAKRRLICLLHRNGSPRLRQQPLLMVCRCHGRQMSRMSSRLQWRWAAPAAPGASWHQSPAGKLHECCLRLVIRLHSLRCWV